MRHKDESKQQAITDATVKLVNETGFAAASVAKIARQAGVSPATLYIYYRNKEDLLVSTYVEIKRKFGLAVARNFDPSLPIRDKLARFWGNAFTCIREEPALFHFSEQFAKTPYADLVPPSVMEEYFEPIFTTLREGIRQKIIKDVPLEILSVFMFHPVMQLADPKLCAGFGNRADDVDLAFSLAWDAIRL
ncbi:MAG: TetR/AcrR family transcriptional regulator [Bacteroidota bacterium]|nr:TetR/AcrR family transcriptional regulator [Bacteroidota bacterium]